MSESVRDGEPATRDQVRHRRRVEPSGACVPVEAPKRHGNLVRRAAAAVPIVRMVCANRSISTMVQLSDDRIGCFALDIESARAPHPRLRLYAADPVREAGNPPQVLDNVLLRDQPNWYNAPGGVGDSYPENCLSQPASFGVMTLGHALMVS